MTDVVRSSFVPSLFAPAGRGSPAKGLGAGWTVAAAGRSAWSTADGTLSSTHRPAASPLVTLEAGGAAMSAGAASGPPKPRAAADDCADLGGPCGKTAPLVASSPAPRASRGCLAGKSNSGLGAAEEPSPPPPPPPAFSQSLPARHPPRSPRQALPSASGWPSRSPPPVFSGDTAPAAPVPAPAPAPAVAAAAVMRLPPVSVATPRGLPPLAPLCAAGVGGVDGGRRRSAGDEWPATCAPPRRRLVPGPRERGGWGGGSPGTRVDLGGANVTGRPVVAKQTISRHETGREGVKEREIEGQTTREVERAREREGSLCQGRGRGSATWWRADTVCAPSGRLSIHYICTSG